MQADMKFAIVPAATAFRPSRARSDLRRGRKAADAADLNRDRAEIRKAAQRVGGDGERARIQLILHRAELLEGDKLIQHQPRAQKIADSAAIVAFHAQQPRDRAKTHSRKSAAA